MVSTISQSKKKPSSCMVVPIRSRTKLFAPSQPTTKRASTKRCLSTLLVNVTCT